MAEQMNHIWIIVLLIVRIHSCIPQIFGYMIYIMAIHIELWKTAYIAYQTYIIEQMNQWIMYEYILTMNIRNPDIKSGAYIH